MSKTRKTATSATAVGTALTILWTAGAAQPITAQGPEADPHAWYEAIRAELEAGFETTLNTASENGAPTGLLAQTRRQMEGILANLDTEMDGIEAGIRMERAEHDPQEAHFCGADFVAARLLQRVRKDPADTQDALLAAVQCGTAYRGTVSIPATEEIENLRGLCFSARDRIVEHRHNPEIIFEPERSGPLRLGAMRSLPGRRGVRRAVDRNRLWIPRRRPHREDVDEQLPPGRFHRTVNTPALTTHIKRHTGAPRRDGPA